METKFGKECIFFVASASPDKARDMFSSFGIAAKYNLVHLRGDANRDLATLSMTQHVITSADTYGFWGAWLAVYYSDFAKKGSKFHERFCPSCFYPPQWVALR